MRLAYVATVVLALACSTDKTLRESTTTQLSSTGGTAHSADGLLTLELPAGALSGPTSITIEVDRNTQRSGLVSALYKLGPTGLTFAVPVTIGLSVAGLAPGHSFVLANADGAAPLPVTGSTYVAAQQLLSGSLSHFSSYGAFDLSTGCDPSMFDPANVLDCTTALACLDSWAADASACAAIVTQGPCDADARCAWDIDLSVCISLEPPYCLPGENPVCASDPVNPGNNTIVCQIPCTPGPDGDTFCQTDHGPCSTCNAASGFWTCSPLSCVSECAPGPVGDSVCAGSYDATYYCAAGGACQQGGLCENINCCSGYGDDAYCQTTVGTCSTCSATSAESGMWMCTFPPACGAAQCRSDVECDSSAFYFCAPPEGPLNCGICWNNGSCSTDLDCSSGSVCDAQNLANQCPVCSGPTCVPMCSADADCLMGQTCTTSGHCQTTTCASELDCPTYFTCSTNQCTRISCATDSDCGGGVCVDGSCYATFGTCEQTAM